MEDPTIVLLRWSDDCPSNNLSISDAIHGMQQNDMASLYHDVRSLSRASRQRLRKRRYPSSHQKRCPRSCFVWGQPHLSCRQRRKKRFVSECTDEAYWDKRLAELDHEERIEFMDPVQLYHNFGHSAAEIESLRPGLLELVEETEYIEDWVKAPYPPSPEAEMQTLIAPSWTSYLYPPFAPVSPSHLADMAYVETTTFSYHRNASGLWELAYANPQYNENDPAESSDPHGCSHYPLSADSCSLNLGFCKCSCADFGDEWRSPEETWRGYLLDWLGEEERDGLSYADARQVCMRERAKVAVKEKNSYTKADALAVKDKMGLEGEWTFVRAHANRPRKEEWDMVSLPSSTGSWRILDVT